MSNLADELYPTKFHVMFTKGKWRWYKEGNKVAYMTRKNKSEVMVAAVYRIAGDGGDLIVHKENGEVDFILDNWVE